MFKKNDTYKRKQLFSIENKIPEKMRKKLKATIYPLFYEEVFYWIDESVFEPLYSQNRNSEPRERRSNDYQCPYATKHTQ
jgi:hypothetical protein